MSSKAAARVNSKTVGHGSWPPRPTRSEANGGGMPGVYIDSDKGGGAAAYGQPPADGSQWEHHPGKPPHNSSKYDTTNDIPNPSVFVGPDSKPLARIGDTVDIQNDKIAGGSPTVFVGDNSEFASFSAPDVAFAVEQADIDAVDSSNSSAKGAVATSSLATGVSSGIVPSNSAMINTPTTQGVVDTKQPPATASTPVTGDFNNYNQDNIPYDTLMLTDKTSLADFTIKAALWGNQPSPRGPNTPYTSNNPAGGDNKYIKAQYGLTVPQILNNLANLAKNVYEPIKARYPRVIITNTFRQGPPGAAKTQAQHGLGMAMDLVFPGYSNNQYYDIAVWIRDNLPFDQLLQEKCGPKIWIHISHYSGNGTQVPKQNKVANVIVSPYQFTPGLAPLA